MSILNPATRACRTLTLRHRTSTPANNRLGGQVGWLIHIDLAIHAISTLTLILATLTATLVGNCLKGQRCSASRCRTLRYDQRPYTRICDIKLISRIVADTSLSARTLHFRDPITASLRPCSIRPILRWVPTTIPCTANVHLKSHSSDLLHSILVNAALRGVSSKSRHSSRRSSRQHNKQQCIARNMLGERVTEKEKYKCAMRK
jgi:hypothetical protein